MCDLAVTHKLHYIVDGSGNYYRINDKDQLVMAKDWRDAGVFSFADANQRIGGGKKSHFYTAIPIEADKISVSDDWEEGGDLEMEVANNTKDFIRVLPEAGTVVNEGRVANEGTEDGLSLPYDLKQMDWNEYLLHFAYVASNVQNYKDELIQKQSDLDLQISDIMHYIELYDVDGADSVRMIQLLKECREERRDVKDEWCRVDHFQRAIGNSANVAKAKDAMKQLAKLEKRSYRPRKLDGLFRETPEETVRENKLMRVFSYENCMAFEGTESEREDCKGNEEKGSATMEYTKQWTVFDGKTNDWNAFAREQQEFYENVEQYMMNLQIEVAELGEQIESMLCEIEDANYVEYEIILVKDEKTSSSLNDNIKVYLEKEKRGTYSKVVEPTIFKSNITDRELGNDLMSVYKQKKTTSGSDNYRLRLWVSDTAVFNAGEVQNFGVKVAIKGIAK